MTGRPSSAPRTSAGAVRTNAFIWFMACVRAFSAESLATFRTRIISTLRVPDFGEPWAPPARTARAAASASMGSLLPSLPRRSRESIGTADLDDRVATTGEEAGQTGPKRAGAFDTESSDLAHASGPSFKARIAGGTGSKPVLAQTDAKPVDCHGHVLIFVSVDSNHCPDAAQMCDGGHSCLLVFRAG